MFCKICNKNVHSLKTHFLETHTTTDSFKQFCTEYHKDSQPNCPICNTKIPLTFSSRFPTGSYNKTCGNSSCVHLFSNKIAQIKFEENNPGKSFKEHLHEKALKGAKTLAKNMQEKYGPDITNPAQLQSTKDKVKQTNFEKYGDWYGKTETYKEQVKQNALEKYGVDSVNKVPDKIEKYKKTCLEKYGSDNWFGNKENREKVLKTLEEKYGVSNVSQIPEVQNKISITKKKNNTFNSSFLEDYLYKTLVYIYGEDNVIRQYQNEKYANIYTNRLFNCDFYIKPLELYIELQGSTAHGLAPFVNEEKSKQSLEYISKDKRFGFEYYLNTDVNKRSSAKRNKLKYIELFFNKAEYYTKDKVESYINEYLTTGKTIFTYDDIEINEDEILYL